MAINNDFSSQEIPQFVIDDLARFLLPKIQKYYESEEGQQAFKEWQECHKERSGTA